MEGHWDEVPLVDVPGAGDDLDGFLFAHVDLANPHVVAVGVALHGEDLPHHHMVDLGPQVLGGLHLGPGEGHGLGKVFVIGVDVYELVQPFSAQ